MNRIDRLNAILIQLQSKRVVKAQEIADRFNISLRTVYRDIRALEESGVPIGAEAGVGYFLQENYHLPPVSFTNEEASALLFGEKLVENMSDNKIKSDFCSALFKVKAILKPNEKDHLEKLHEKVFVYNFFSGIDSNRQLFLSEIQQSLVNKQILNIKYESKYADEPLWRKVEPIGLCNYSSRWHLFAWCHLRQEYRDFRLDRILELKATNEFYKGKTHLSIKEYLAKVSDVSSNANISVIIPKERKKLIQESRYWYGFLGEENSGDQERIFFSNSDLNGFANWLIQTGCHAKVEFPEELKSILLKKVEDLSKTYL